MRLYGENHAQRRAFERYRLPLLRAEEFAAIRAQVRSRRARFLGENESGRSWWEVRVGGRRAVVVMDETLTFAVTFLSRRRRRRERVGDD